VKTHYTCQAHVRGTSEPGCHKIISADAHDSKTLKKAGWAHNGNYRRDHWKCPVCKSKEKQAMRWEELFDWGELRFERKLTAEDFSVESLPYEEIPEPFERMVKDFRRLHRNARASALRAFYGLRRTVTLKGCSRVHVPEGTTVVHAWCDCCEGWTTFNTQNDLDRCDGCDSVISKGELEDDEKTTLAYKQFVRGYSDANAGHSPSLLRGPYTDGYASAKSGYTVEQGRVWAKGIREQEKDSLRMKYLVAYKRIEELEVEREKMLTRARAMLMWVPKDDANRKWFEEQDSE